MALASGMAGQVMLGDESSYAVGVTPTVGMPLINEKIKTQVDRDESKGILAGARVIRSQQWTPGNKWTFGSLGFEVYDRSQSLLWKHMLGSISTSGAGPYTHTCTPGDLTGKSLTVQIGRPDANGTVDPFTFVGSKITKWELACKANEIATLGLDLVSKHEIRYRTAADGVTTSGSPTVTSAVNAAFTQDDVGKPISSGTAAIPAASYVGVVNSATSIGLSSSPTANVPVNATATTSSNVLTLGIALAAAAYASSIAPMSFAGASVTLAGSSYPTRELKVAGDNGLNEKRIFLGQDTISEPLEANLRSYTGSIDSEFLGYTAYQRFINGAEAALVFALVKGASTVTVTMNVRFDGDSPTVDGPDILGQMLPFKCIGPTTDAGAFTAVIVDTTATP